jgi:hypothetical protein
MDPLVGDSEDGGGVGRADSAAGQSDGCVAGRRDAHDVDAGGLGIPAALPRGLVAAVEHDLQRRNPELAAQSVLHPLPGSRELERIEIATAL